MANLSNETITAVFELQRQLLQIINQATELEFSILEQFGETETTIIELDEIQNVKERASAYYTRLYRLLWQISQVQPIADSATLDLLSQSLIQTQAIADAGQASLIEIKRNWNL
ncbi:hypothetical protein [Pleurocapsa sp. PCC 7319]|uniref:hypothetical protein n=1 Tax=Pleurocapsa sp. PCC 7319 TaxID=118161 RepID=UPI00034DC1A3|nr:hypothetical protein [Pleurocapsa sp. PCC 7319]